MESFHAPESRDADIFIAYVGKSIEFHVFFVESEGVGRHDGKGEVCCHFFLGFLNDLNYSD